MLKRLHLRNFTVFANAEFEFGEGLNVLVGANGTGKTHVLKVGYAMALELVELLYFSRRENKSHEAAKQHYRTPYYDTSYMTVVQDKIKSTFQASPLQGGVNDLVRHNTDATLSTLNISVTYPDSEQQFDCSIDTAGVKAPWPSFTWVEFGRDVTPIPPAFIPAKEVLTMGWLLPLYNRREIPIDETYPDLLRLLSGPPLRQPEPAHIVDKLAQLIGGKVEEEGGRFYLAAPDQPRLEMNLVAEGMRKFATLYKLLANGTLTPETTLFWDEPEANLKPGATQGTSRRIDGLGAGRLSNYFGYAQFILVKRVAHSGAKWQANTLFRLECPARRGSNGSYGR